MNRNGQGPAVTIGLWSTGPVDTHFQNLKGEKVGIVSWAVELVSFHQLCQVIARADTDEERWKDGFPLVMATVERMPSVLVVGADALSELGGRMRDSFFRMVQQRASELIARDEATAAEIEARDRAVGEAMRDLATPPEVTKETVTESLEPLENVPTGEASAEPVSSEGAQRSGN